MDTTTSTTVSRNVVYRYGFQSEPRSTLLCLVRRSTRLNLVGAFMYESLSAPLILDMCFCSLEDHIKSTVSHTKAHDLIAPGVNSSFAGVVASTIGHLWELLEELTYRSARSFVVRHWLSRELAI